MPYGREPVDDPYRPRHHRARHLHREGAMSNAVCMVYDDSGNAFDCFEYTPEALAARALELRRERGEISTVTIEPSPFVVHQTTGVAR